MKKPPDSPAKSGTEPRPPAFKNSELGSIPAEWEVKRLGEVWSKFKTGPFGSSLHANDYVQGGIPIINPMHILNGRIIPSEEMSVDDETAQRLSEYRLELNDVIIGRRGEMGRVALVTPHEEGWVCGTGCFFVHFKDTIHAPYLSWYLRTPQCIRRLVGEAVGTTLVNLNQAILENTLVPLPPLPEQHRIAAALSDVDAWIESLEKLIEKKKLVKQGAMQELLTGKTRLPGFGGAEFKRTEIGSIPKDWELKKLGEILTFKNGYNAPSKAYGQGCPFISVLDILEQWPITLDSIRGKVMLNASARNAFSVRDGDLFFMRSSETSEDVGKANVFLGNNGCAVYGGFVIRGRPFVEIDSLFLNYLLKDEAHRKRISANGAGAQHFNIGQTGLAEVEITLPALAEQHAIAEVLSDMDAELASLSREKAKAEQIKQGMMQELLTGRVRLAGGEERNNYAT